MRSLLLPLCTIAMLILEPSPGSAQVSNLHLTPNQRLDSAVALLKSSSHTNSRRALDMFVELPGHLVVPRLLDELDRNDELSEPSRRRNVFIALSVQHAWSDRRLIELFLNGLEDSSVTDLCLKALRSAPEDQRDLLVEVFTDHLNYTLAGRDYISATIVNLLLDFGPVSKPALGALGSLLRSTEGGLAANRVGAGLAISEIGGIDAALTEYHELDSTALKGALVGLSNLGLQSEGQFDRDSIHIAEARQIVLSALTSSSSGAVTYATDAIYGVFGADLYSFDQTLNSQVKQALITAAERTSSPDIRQTLISTLRRLEEGPADY